MAALLLGSQSLAQTRTTLPIPPAPFNGVIKESVVDSTPSMRAPLRAPAGAPNIFLFLADDVGFSMSSTFGGPVPTPSMDRLAASGERYNRFHTTAICSTTRAALLTGRNHHNAHSGYFPEMPMGYPGYDARMPPSQATIAQILRLNGYNTAMFGKWHQILADQHSDAGPFDLWPTGQGFEYFFGIPQGETDQWHPNVYRGISRLPDYDGPEKVLDQRLADDAITWVDNHIAAAPDKPFFIYYAPHSTHVPHQAPPEYIARFKGRFDQGWDAMREETYKRQLAQGLIPRGTKLTPRPDVIPAWSSLSPTQKAFAARSIEVAAAMLAYQDAQLGRIMDELQRTGELDNTLVVIIQGDNGASEEGGPSGTPNEWASILNTKANVTEDGVQNRANAEEAWFTANIDKLGTDATYENYPAGWAWAMNTPFKWGKEFASMLGGIRDGMIISWKGHIASPNGVCAEFGHVVDIAPTLLDAAQVPAPDTVYGVKQKPFDGQSLLGSLAHCESDKPRTQYFELVGKRGLYQNGWFASNDDGRLPWQPMTAPGGPNPPHAWQLFNLDADFSQADDLGAKYPDKLKSMVQSWNDEATKNNVFPINHSMTQARGIVPAGRKRFDLWGKEVSLPAQPDGPFSRNPFAGSFAMDAEVDLAKDQASGVIAAVGSHFAGWSFYLENGRPTFVYAASTKPEEIVKISSNILLPKGPGKLHLDFDSQGPGQAAQVKIVHDGAVIASGAIAKTFVVPAGTGEMFDAGRDTGVTVTDYATPHGRVEGDIPHVSLTAK
jgi:arylsulfatase